MGEIVVTVKLRLRDKHARELTRQARAVNFVWNFCNKTQKKAVGMGRPWLSAFELMRLTAGSSKELGLHAHTIQRVCKQYVESRKQQGRPWLRFRGRKSLGWVPFNTGHVTLDGAGFRFNGARFDPMHLRDLLNAGDGFAAGSFNQDARGRWYINLPVADARQDSSPCGSVGVDLGLKALASMSDGSVIEAPRFYRASEEALSTAQRARKSKRAKAIHAKARNRRKDFLHKASRALAERYGTIIVGDVSPSKLAKTRMAKSVNDAGWAGFKHMLSYKAIRHGGRFLEVSEAYSTQICSACGSLPSSRPKGIAGLGIRGWTCDDCGAVHDRDANAARNILRVGLNTLAEGVRQ